jgi:putative transposase
MGMRAGEAGEAPSGGHQRIGRSTHEETTLSETRRKYRKFTAQQKLELVMAAIDRCTREIVAWHLQTRCRAKEAIGLIERAATERGIPPGTLTGRRSPPERYKAVLAGPGITHRRGGYRDPESQAFTESWFGKLKERCVWRHEFVTLDEARKAIGNYVEHYHDRPRSRLHYRTPREVAATWNDGGRPHLIPAA